MERGRSLKHLEARCIATLQIETEGLAAVDTSSILGTNDTLHTHAHHSIAYIKTLPIDVCSLPENQEIVKLKQAPNKKVKPMNRGLWS